MGWKLRPNMTPGRRRLLTDMVQNGIAHRGRGTAGFCCMSLGWTEWVRDESGRIIGERITEAGREALRKAGGELCTGDQ